MSGTLARLADALDRLGRRVSAFDLLDAILIAPHLRFAPLPPRPTSPPPEAGRTPTDAPHTPEPTAEPPLPPPPPEFPLESAGTRTGPGRGAVAVRLPAGGPPLRGRPFARAFLGFRHRVPSRVRWELDEEGTVLVRAETRLPLVRLRDVPERAVTLCLVVDRSASMEVWADTVRALVRTATGAGVFRAVRLLKLDTDGDRPAVGRWHGTPRADGVRPPSGVGAVVLVVSDLCSRAWWNGSAFRLFAGWSRAVPVGLMGLLPDTFWPRTAIGRMRLVPLVRPAPAGAIHMLSLPGYEAGGVLPVGSLEPRAVASLAGLLGHNGTEARGVGVWVPVASETGFPPQQPGNRPSAQEVVRRFIAAASPPAVRLAGLLALFHRPTARTLRLVRGAAGLTTEPIHEAEVLLGGLMRGERREGDGRRVWEYTFHPGVQDELIRLAMWGETEPQRFLDHFHTYLERRKQELNGIRAAVRTTGEATVRGLEDQFLTVNAATLTALGPRGADLSRLLSEVRQAEAAGPLHLPPSGTVADAGGNESQRYKSGFVGQFNTGKSTLLNAALGSPRADRKPSNLRLHVDSPLYGQDAFLRSLRAGVSDGRARQVLYGAQGVSKTHLADRYARAFADDYSALLYVNARSAESLRNGLAALADEHVLDLPGRADLSVEERAAAVEGWLNHHPSWLLILDNADTADAAPAVIALSNRLAGGHVVVTSREADWWRPHFDAHEVRPPDITEAADFLLARTDGSRQKRETDAADALQLARELGGVGLNRAADVIAFARWSVAEYLTAWLAALEQVRAFRPPTATYPPEMAASWLVSFNVLSDRVKRLQCVLASFAPDVLPVGVVVVPDGVWTMADVEELGRLTKVVRRSSEDAVVLASSILQATRDWMPADERTDSLRDAARLLERAVEALPVAGPDRDLKLAQLTPHLRAVVGHLETAGLNRLARPLRAFVPPSHFARLAGVTVFVCYAGKYDETAAPTVNALRAGGVQVLVEQEPQRSVRTWQQQLADSLSRSDVVIALLSSAAFGAELLRREVELAVQEKVPVVCVRLEPMSVPINFPLYARRSEFIWRASLTDAEYFDQLETALGQAVQGGRLAYDFGYLDMARGGVVQVLFRAGTLLRSLQPGVIPIISPAGMPRPRLFSLLRRHPDNDRFEPYLSFEFPDGIRGPSLTVNYDPTALHSFRVTDETGQEGRSRQDLTDDDEKPERLAVPDPWEAVGVKYPPGTRVTGVVQNLTNYGAFVEVEEGITGLLHVNDMSWTKRVTHPSEVVQKGQTITCVVMSVDAERKRVALGLKQLTPDPWAADIPARYRPGMKVPGRVSKLTNFGAFIELEPGFEGLLHLSELSDTPVESPDEVLAVGDRVEVKVLRVDPVGRKIGLTLRNVEAPTVPEEPTVAVPPPLSEGRPKIDDTIRVYVLAKGLNVESKAILDVCRELGYERVKNQLSSLTPDQVEQIRKRLAEQPPPSPPSPPPKVADLHDLAVKLAERGDSKAAIAAYQRWAEADPSVDSYLRAALYAERVGALGHAEFLFNHAKKYGRNHPDVIAGIARIMDRKRPAEE